MHWMDRLSTFGAGRLSPEERPFHQGWGDEAVIEQYLGYVRTVPPDAGVDLMVRPARRTGTIVVRDILYRSPAEQLPERISLARARWATKYPEPERLVILHASWNDENHRARMTLARRLLDHGIASIITEHPYYGSRRIDRPAGAPIATVSDFCLMGRAAVLEGRALANEFARRGYTVGVSGYSMGGNISGFVASVTDGPVAAAPLAAAYSPGPVFSDGILRQTISWDALGGATEDVADRLWHVLGAASILDFPPPPHTRAAVLVAGTKDGFVPGATTLGLHRHWPGSKMDWVTAGHGSLLLRNRDRLVAAIVDSFDRLAALVAAGEAEA